MKLFIGCSSSNNIPDKYLKDCSNYLDELLRENDIVFGGCSTGLMGLAYNITKEYNNKVIGISPTIFKSDLDILDCDEKIITDNTSRRTEELINNSDALIFLPGGIGTIYELFTAIELKRNHEFRQEGRIHTEAQSVVIDEKIKEFLQELSVDYTMVSSSNALDVVYKMVNEDFYEQQHK